MEKLDYIILGDSISSQILSRLLIQKKYHIKLIKFNIVDNSKKNSNLYPISLNLLREYSIPYLEMSYANSKNLSAYLERFVSLEKYFFEPVILKDNFTSDGQFFNNFDLGVVNSSLFERYLTKLAEMKNLLCLDAKDIKYEKKEKKHIINIDGTYNFECNNVIISDSTPDKILENLGISIERKNPFHKISFEIDSILTDTIEYFFDFTLKCSFISIIPGKSTTKINLYLKSKDESNNYKEIVNLLLKERYNLNGSKTKFYTESTSFLEVKINNTNNFPFILSGGEKTVFSQPLLGNPLSISIISAFKCYNSLISLKHDQYANWIRNLQHIHNNANYIFYNQLLNQDLFLFGKILSKKYISKLNLIQKLMIKIRMKSLKNPKYSDFPIINVIKILNFSYIENLDKQDDKNLS